MRARRRTGAHPARRVPPIALRATFMRPARAGPGGRPSPRRPSPRPTGPASGTAGSPRRMPSRMADGFAAFAANDEEKGCHPPTTLSSSPAVTLSSSPAGLTGGSSRRRIPQRALGLASTPHGFAGQAGERRFNDQSSVISHQHTCTASVTRRCALPGVGHQLDRQVHIPLVTRRLDRRVQRVVERATGAGPGIIASWVRRSNRRTTRERECHPPALIFFFLSSADLIGGSSRKRGQSPVPKMRSPPDGFADQVGERSVWEGVTRHASVPKMKLFTDDL